MAGVINPRKLIKAQQKLASSKHGCRLLDGQVERITKMKEDGHNLKFRESYFLVDVSKYVTGSSIEASSTNVSTQVKTKRVILATGVYTNILPILQVMDKRSKIICIIVQKNNISIIYFIP